MSINFDNLSRVQKDIENNPLTELLIVTKNQSPKDLVDLLKIGYRIFGENRVQEAKEKFTPLSNKYKLNLHLIGPLQTNKVRDALQLFDTIQSLDRPKLVDEIIKISKKIKNLKTKSFYIQVNIGNEPQKNGVKKNSVQEFYNYIKSNNIRVDGLMCIPPNTEDPSSFFQEMYEIKSKMNPELKLSMGMSNDYKYALAKKSNLIRIGSMIFNE